MAGCMSKDVYFCSSDANLIHYNVDCKDRREWSASMVKRNVHCGREWKRKPKLTRLIAT